jgi:hypothetical protein
MSEAAVEPVVEAPVVEATPAPVVAPPAAIIDPAGATPPAEPAVAVQPNWPDDWRDKLAGEDKAYRTLLDRYADPGALAKAHRELQLKLSKGELKATTGMPDNASDEERAAWRKENGIPDKPENYDVRLPNGMVLGDAERPIVNDFLQHAHQNNLPPTVVNVAMDWYMRFQEKQLADQREQDIGKRVQAEENLRADWGADYRPETIRLGEFLSKAPDDLGVDLVAARYPDGSIVGSDPRFVRWMAGIRRELDPMGSLVPAGTADPVKAGAARLGELKAMLNTEDGYRNYWSGPNAKALQNEMFELLQAQQRMADRAA